MALQGSLQDLEKQVITEDSQGLAAKRIVVSDSSLPSGAATEATLQEILNSLNGEPDSDFISEFNEISSVVGGSEATILTYTVPIATDFHMQKIDVSGTNIATFNIYVNTIIQARQRTYFGGSLNVNFDFSNVAKKGYPLEAGDIVEIKVIHSRPEAGDFDARLQGVVV